MNIDSLGEGKIEILFDNKLVNSPADLYHLNKDKHTGIRKDHQQRRWKDQEAQLPG